MDLYLQAIKNYTKSKGRANREEYFVILYIHSFIMTAIFCIRYFVFFDYLDNDGLVLISKFLLTIYGIFIFMQILFMTIRRLHDIGKNGAFILLNFIPLIGTIWLIMLLLQKGDEGENEYGPEKFL